MTKRPVRKLNVNANVLAIAGVIVMILAAVLAVKLFPRREEPEAVLPEGFEVIGENAAPQETQEPAASLPDPDQAYIVITAHGTIYEPIPLTGPKAYGLRYGEQINIIEVTENSICMAESTCENQDCVLQGTVTLENRKTRVLQNMILCLPNDVGLELCTFAELQEKMPEWAEAQLQ